MPWSLVAVLLLEALVVLVGVGLRVAAGEGPLDVAPSLLIPALLLYGFVKGHRLAWQWGRIAGLVGLGVAVAVPVLVLMGAQDARGSQAVVAFTAIGIGLPLGLIALLLGRPEVRDWFRLTCPVCQGRNVRSADFLFTKARCRGCQSVF